LERELDCDSAMVGVAMTGDAGWHSYVDGSRE
jgi:hypothetical protein